MRLHLLNDKSSVEGDTSPTYVLYRLGPAFWRFSLHTLREFEFYRCSSYEELADKVRESLINNPSLSQWLDVLAKRPPGFFADLVKRPSSSDTRRAVEYAAELLISSVIKNDTGVKGGLSVVCSDFDNTDTGHLNHEIFLPLGNDILIKNIRDYPNPESLIGSRQNVQTLLVPIDLESRVYLTDSEWMFINDICNTLFLHALKITICPFNQDSIRIFAIDFFKRSNKWVPFEWHLPGRGIGMHSLPFVNQKAGQGCSTTPTLLAIADSIKMRWPECGLTVGSISANDAFHRMDEIFVDSINSYIASISSVGSGHSPIYFELELPHDIPYDMLPTRHIPDHLDRGQTELLSKEDDRDKRLDEIIAKLGPWVVIKQHTNVPWWHPKRLRPQAVLLTSNWGRRTLDRFIANGAVQVEAVITDSLDHLGHFGELRVYCIGIPI